MAGAIESDIEAREQVEKELQAHNEALEHELRVARELIDEAKARVDGPLLGDSVVVRGLREAVEQLAETDDTLLLTGPPGAGQEAIARTIHGQSERNNRAFIYVNCATLRTSPGLKLIGSAAQGDAATPGAGPVGKLELADGGTLYLDSINALPPKAQAQLAEQLADFEAQRRAGEMPSPDVRVIAYTPKDLGEHTTGGRFNSALFKHLVKQQLYVPPLLERQDDIPVLVNYFAREHAQRMGKPLEGVAEQSMQRLEEYRWPGNINELKNLLERVVVAATGPVLEVDESFLEEGIELDRYRLVDKLGEGGMGEVWLARHQMLARPAAVKLVRSEVFSSGEESEAAVQRFQREAKAIANLQSPHTVELYDFGVSESGAFYYVMELLHGLDLNSMIEKFGPMPAERVVMLLQQACRSLTEAHDAGLVHRDIKPANLFVCKLGPECDFLKVLDFGIVKAVAETDKTAMTALTQAGQFTGTPAYTAPEQALEGGNVGPQTDLYALGCVAYWMLTGRTVFEADSPMQVLVHHTQTHPVPPSRMTEQPVPESLDAVILALLAKSPGERPGSAHELWRMLGDVDLAKPWTDLRAEEWWQLHGAEMAGPERSAPTNPTG
jgi:DNA-binding NtrC family response regulator